MSAIPPVDAVRTGAAHALAEIWHGRIQQSKAGVTAASALLVCAEVYCEHHEGSSGRGCCFRNTIS